MDSVKDVRETLTAMFNDKLKAIVTMNGGNMKAQTKAGVKQEGRSGLTGRFLKGNSISTKHGATQYLSDGKLKGRPHERLRKDLRRIKKELELMLSKNGDPISIKSELLISQVVECHGFCQIFTAHLKEYGVLDPNTLKKKVVSFQPGFTLYLSLLSRQNTALISLGLSAEEKGRVLSPLEFIAGEESGS